MTNPSRPAIYCRISRDVEGAGLGVERQTKECAALITRLGWGEAVLYIDNDISAYSGKRRPRYEAMMDDLKNGVRDGLVCWHPDRLTRRPTELEHLIDVIEVIGVPIATVTAGDYDLQTSAGRAHARILGAVARMESEHKSERLRSKMAELVEKGKPNGGPAGFGYRRVDGRLEIEPTEADLIRKASAEVLAGKPLAWIAKEWTEAGVQSERGGKWWTGAIARVLSNPRNAGLRTHKGEVVGRSDEWEAIVDETTWRRLQALFNDPKRRPSEKVTTRLLTGVLVCGRCGAGINAGRRYDGARKYFCMRCGVGTSKALVLEAVVTEEVFRVVDTPAFADALKRAETDDSQDLIAIIEEGEAELRALAEAAKAGKVRASMLIEVGATIEARIAEARAKLTPTTSDDVSQWAGQGERLRRAWEDMTIPEQRRVIQAVVGAVVLKPGVRGSKLAVSPEGMRKRLIFRP